MLFFCFASFAKHPFYMSVSELNYKSDKKILEISIRIFVNDFEKALKSRTTLKVDLINGNNAQNQQLINNYIAKQFKIKINGKLKELTIIGYEHEKDAIWSYFELKGCDFPKKIEIENSILYEIFKEQSNIVRCKVNTTEKNSKVNNPDKHINFDF